MIKNEIFTNVIYSLKEKGLFLFLGKNNFKNYKNIKNCFIFFF